MGTQKKIAKKIREKKAGYVLSLKGNHSTLHDEIRLFLSTEIEKPHQGKSHKIIDWHEDHDKGHDRVEHRLCYVTDHLAWLEQQPRLV